MDHASNVWAAMAGFFSVPMVILVPIAIFMFANVKSLLLVYHIRCFNGVIKHLYFIPHNWKQNTTDLSVLFQPIITSSHASLLECDYNGHKSSSTYFTDLDVSRLHLLSCLLHRGIKTLQSNPIIGPKGEKVGGSFGFVLGGIECSYRREIKPYEKYEVWSRVLAWDRKWLYLVSHFVKKGAVKPAGYTLSNGKWFGQTKTRGKSIQETPGSKGEKNTNTHGTTNRYPAINVPKTALFASAISKYVFKKGRLTVHPEMVLEASGLLPARPGGWATLSGPAPTVDVLSMDDGDTEWTWKKVEAQNTRGLKLAENFAALDGLFEVFTGSETPALGAYSDLII